jgi:hypothetical protein
MHPDILARVLRLIASALTLVAQAQPRPDQAAVMLRKAASQLDEVS